MSCSSSSTMVTCWRKWSTDCHHLIRRCVIEVDISFSSFPFSSAANRFVVVTLVVFELDLFCRPPDSSILWDVFPSLKNVIHASLGAHLLLFLMPIACTLFNLFSPPLYPRLPCIHLIADPRDLNLILYGKVRVGFSQSLQCTQHSSCWLHTRAVLCRPWNVSNTK